MGQQLSPVVVYLDLNHLINLAKEHKLGNSEVFNRVLSLVESGKVIVPITAPHLMEIMAIGKESQRRDIGVVVNSLSKRAVLRSFHDMMYLEVFSAAASHYGVATNTRSPKDFVLSYGYSRAFGEIQVDFTPWRDQNPAKAAEAEDQFWEAVEGEAALDFLLSKYIPKVGTGSKEHNDLIQATEQDRAANAHKTKEQVEEECVLGLFQQFVGLFMKACGELKLDWGQVSSNPPRHFWTKEYMATLPTIDVWSKLLAYLYRNPSAPIKVNHVYDIGHLSVALPYCDVVVTDREMAHTITANHLDRRYGTKVFASLEDAVSYLENLS